MPATNLEEQSSCSPCDTNTWPDWMVYPILLLLIGGFVAWGYTPHNTKPIQDQALGMGIYIVLSVTVFALLIGMFFKLEQTSGRRNRKRLFSGSTSHDRGWHLPWDSYMCPPLPLALTMARWGAGTMHILEFTIFIGMALPVLRDDGVVIWVVAVTWCVAAGVWLLCVIFLLHHNPSEGQEEEVCLSPTSDGEVGTHLGRGVSYQDGSERVLAPAVHKYCKVCKKWYPGNLRKHCWDCNKCVTEFDHHCPFLNQCIGKSNYVPFMALLFSSVAVHTLAVGVGADVLVEMWTGNVETDASTKWGSALFACNITFMIVFALMLLGPFSALLYFQLQLVWRSKESGKPETTFMYVPDHTGKVRGIKAYLDVAALETLSNLVFRLHMSRSSAFALWKVYATSTAEEREQQEFTDSMSSVQTSALSLSGTGPWARTSGQVTSGENATPEAGSWFQGHPSESDPLIAPAMERIDDNLENGHPKEDPQGPGKEKPHKKSKCEKCVIS